MTKDERRSEASRANGAKSRGPVTPEGKVRSIANSAHSTGPRTDEGKARSSRNAIRHGLLAKSIVLDVESADMFREILTDLENELQPDSPIERRFVETMAISEWRRLRLLSLEKEQLSMEMERQQHTAIESRVNAEAPAPTDENPGSVEINPARHLVNAFQVITGHSRVSELLSRYENRHDRQYARALAGLRAHRAEKRKMARDVRSEINRLNARKRMISMRNSQKHENRGDQTN